MLYFIRRSLCYSDPEIQHQQPLTQIHYQAHLMFDQENSKMKLLPYPADKVHKFIDLSGVHPRCRLIEKQQFRLRG
jgi:hypothetical protein